MTISISTLRKAIPLIKEYAKGRGTHTDQQFPNDHPWRGNATAAWIHDGKLTRVSSGSQYCTGYLFSHLIVNIKPIILVQVQPCWPDLNIDAYHAYINWLVNDSPWSDAFISKNFNRIMRDGVIVIDGTQSRPFVKEATIAARMAWENYHKNGKYREVGVWYELSQKINPNLAYVVAKLCTTVLKASTNKIIRKQQESGHAAINSSIEQKNMHVNGWLIKNRSKGGNNVWSYKKGSKSVTEAVYSLIDELDGEEKKNNPFFTTSVSKQYDRKQFIEAMHEKLPALEERYFNV